MTMQQKQTQATAPAANEGLLLSKFVKLEEGEEVLFENERVLLTNRRVMAEFRKGVAGEIAPRREALLKDVATVQKIEGGQESRLGPGIQFTVGGAVAAGVVTGLEILDLLPRLVEGLLFLFSAILLGVGLYLVVTSVFRIKPHTAVIFIIFGKKDIHVPFPDSHNPDADKLAAAFTRARRAY